MILRKRIERLEETVQSYFGYEHLTLQQLHRLLFLHNKSRDLSNYNLLTIEELDELSIIFDACSPEKTTSKQSKSSIENLSDEEFEQYDNVIKAMRENRQTSMRSRDELERELSLRYRNSNLII